MWGEDGKGNGICISNISDFGKRPSKPKRWEGVYKIQVWKQFATP